MSVSLQPHHRRHHPCLDLQHVHPKAGCGCPAQGSTGAVGDVGDIQGALGVEESTGSSSPGGVLSLPPAAPLNPQLQRAGGVWGRRWRWSHQSRSMVGNG